MSNFYEFRMLNLASRYRIKENALKMLKAHEEFKTGRIDEAELGRQMRLSPENRAAVIATMVSCAGIMGKKPEESKHCLAIIETCGEIVTIADKPPPTLGFPSFLKLPAELRRRVYSYYLRRGTMGDIMVPRCRRGYCPCAFHDTLSVSARPLSLAFTSKQLRDEVLSQFYRLFTVHFSCACEMGLNLRVNAFMKEHLESVKFHWTGPHADTAITELSLAPSVKSVVVVISRSTTKYPSAKEKKLQRYFTRSGKSVPGLPEALGFDQLSALRGLSSVEVEHIPKKKADLRSSEDRTNLARWLQANIEGEESDSETN